MTATLRIHRLRADAKIPIYATSGAAGLDLFAAMDKAIRLPAKGGRAAIPTGIAVALPESHEGQIRPRSGLARKHGVTVLNAPGTIDEDYRGEIQVLLINWGEEDYVVHPHDRIAQMVVSRVARPEVVVAQDELGTTDRGVGGFGSTGKR